MTGWAIQYDCPEYPDLHGKFHECGIGEGNSTPRLYRFKECAEWDCRALIQDRAAMPVLNLRPKVVPVTITVLGEESHD